MLDGPTLSDGPVQPAPLIFYPLAVVIGMFVGVGLVSLVELGDDAVRTLREVKMQLGVRNCGQIPVITGHKGDRFRTYRAIWHGQIPQPARLSVTWQNR